MFMYMEDDTDVTWQALESWAADTEASPPCACTTPLGACSCVASMSPHSSCHGPCNPGQQGSSAQVLEPLGFSRHFFRTEVRNDTGSLVFLDFQQPVNLTTWNRCAYHQHLEHPLVLTSLQALRRPWFATCSLV